MSMFNKLNLTLHVEHNTNLVQNIPDWGFWNFIPLSELRDPDREFLLDDTSILEVEVKVMKFFDVQAATTASTVVIRHTIDLPLSRFTWIVRNFSQLNNRKYYSNIFLAGGFKWRVLIFPKGNNVDHLSTYLDVQDSSNLPDGWSKYSEFSLSVVDQVHNYCSY
ncbi:hypothetical protein IFM89_013784 [Coptis chinensis]|uniref:MATH domain-containing protein n=1 Tax=Coptis chinensis TaxID=261450 RepID=A0A835LQ91_9MAGN|nr:hypothetical protein IFM89_013784 [Coptis chinensis]